MGERREFVEDKSFLFGCGKGFFYFFIVVLEIVEVFIGGFF